MSYDIISWLGIGASLVCAYLSSQYSTKDESNVVNWTGMGFKLLFCIFSLLFIVSSLGTGVMLAREETGNVTAVEVVNAVANTYVVGIYLFWFFMILTVVGFIVMLLSHMGEDL